MASTENRALARRIASLAPGTWTRNYLRSKLATDPLYEGVWKELANSPHPLLDIGCGMGLLACYLREKGYQPAIRGLDFDSRKIRDGHALVEKGDYSNISLTQGNALSELPDHSGDVTILDILQFLPTGQQSQLLIAAASRVSSSGKLIVRSGLRERNARFFVTWMADLFAKATFWMKSSPTEYPTKELFQMTLGDEGFEVEIKPFWGKTPFNNYLIVARRNSL
jgi:2-polyprenyl-3-methyl-5-hydroxy-6-metoxy-1,4-benzoquinol methylase